jgi:hypothetical protein
MPDEREQEQENELLAELKAEFPGHEIYPGTDGQWHARLRGVLPVVIVRTPHLASLRVLIPESEVAKELEPADDSGRIGYAMVDLRGGNFFSDTA